MPHLHQQFTDALGQAIADVASRSARAE